MQLGWGSPIAVSGGIPRRQSLLFFVEGFKGIQKESRNLLGSQFRSQFRSQFGSQFRSQFRRPVADSGEGMKAGAGPDIVLRRHGSLATVDVVVVTPDIKGGNWYCACRGIDRQTMLR